jgi:hypothetical protein
VITKHPGTGGLVSVGTVTAQLLYEIAAPEYANPDVTAHFDTVELAQAGPDRVAISGVRGSPPPATAKVAVNFDAGYRNTMTLVLTGLDIEAKAAWAAAELFGILGGREQFDDVDVRLLRFDTPDAPDNERATAHLRITVKDRDPRKAGRRFSNATMELALGGYAGFHTTTPPTPESAYGVYWPALIPSALIRHTVVLPDGTARDIPHTPGGGPRRWTPPPAAPAGQDPQEHTERAPLGVICGARSGDKGGNANIGLWTRTAGEFAWLAAYLTVDRLRGLLTEAAALPVQRYELPRLRALNFVVTGLLGEGVAASTRPDPQAKGLGEYIRSRHADIPVRLLRAAGSP